jgi:2-amino-4-hydroxy-6-hydroxymethyldihydropteridine diphosphokinase
MKRVYLGIGSNANREANIKSAIEDLQILFGSLVMSRVYESEAVGFEGENFLNMVVGVDTTMSIETLSHSLRSIEHKYGRAVRGKEQGSITLDLDILTYSNVVGCSFGIELPRSEITTNAFVLKPLAEVAPGVKHPALNKCYQEIWERFDKSAQNLWPIEFGWE